MISPRHGVDVLLEFPPKFFTVTSPALRSLALNASMERLTGPPSR